MTAPIDDFGGRLRQARERRGVSLRQISASTKIAVGVLEALERNDISKLPGGIFSRAFVRSYALEVGLDPDQTVRDFDARFDEQLPAEEDTSAASMADHDTAFEKRRLTALRIARSAGVLGAAVFFASLFLILHHRSQARAAKPAEPPSPSTAPSAAVESPSPAGASAPAASTAAQAPAALPAAMTAGQVTLDLHPTADCWVSASADGRKVFARVMNGGEHQTITFRREATVDVGDASSFAYSIDGREGKPLGDKGQVKTLKLTPSTISDYVR